jgi:hypothetical protein
MRMMVVLDGSLRVIHPDRYRTGYINKTSQFEKLESIMLFFALNCVLQ